MILMMICFNSFSLKDPNFLFSLLNNPKGSDWPLIGQSVGKYQASESALREELVIIRLQIIDFQVFIKNRNKL